MPQSKNPADRNIRVRIVEEVAQDKEKDNSCSLSMTIHYTKLRCDPSGKSEQVKTQPSEAVSALGNALVLAIQDLGDTKADQINTFIQATAQLCKNFFDNLKMPCPEEIRLVLGGSLKKVEEAEGLSDEHRALMTPWFPDPTNKKLH